MLEVRRVYGLTIDRREAAALALYDDNVNGRIICKESRAPDCYRAPRPPGVPFHEGWAGDGMVCK